MLVGGVGFLQVVGHEVTVAEGSPDVAGRLVDVEDAVLYSTALAKSCLAQCESESVSEAGTLKMPDRTGICLP